MPSSHSSCSSARVPDAMPRSCDRSSMQPVLRCCSHLRPKVLLTSVVRLSSGHRRRGTQQWARPSSGAPATSGYVLPGHLPTEPVVARDGRGMYGPWVRRRGWRGDRPTPEGRGSRGRLEPSAVAVETIMGHADHAAVVAGAAVVVSPALANRTCTEIRKALFTLEYRHPRLSFEGSV